MQNHKVEPVAKQDEQNRQHYSKAEFWDQRYVEKGGFFDWYAEFPELKYCFENQYGMKHEDSILMVGCGNSKLSQQMYEAGYKNIVNVDISPSVIEQMKKVSPDMEWLVMDCTKMDFENKKFDFVIDKGTMDALIAGRDLTPSTQLLKDCLRVTKQEGQLILITYGSPEGRKKVFQQALPFDQIDYYFCLVNLSDMSTMINLMRNNLIGPGGEKVQKQQALQRSLKEFMMIKLMRQRRSKDKQFVVWENYAKKKPEVVINETQEVQKTTENKDTKATEAKTQTGLNQQPLSNVRYMSKSQKQTYVYAYSLKRKFGYDFDASAYQNIQQNLYEPTLTGVQFEIKGSQVIQKGISQSLKYLKGKSIAYYKHKYLKQIDNFSKLESEQSEIVRVHIKLTNKEDFKLKVLRKTNIELSASFGSFETINKLNQAMKQLGQTLVQKSGLGLYPCPKTYSLFSMLKSRMNAKTSTQLLNKYWFPTYKIKRIDSQTMKADIVLSIPPVNSQSLAQVLENIKYFFSAKNNSKMPIQIGAIKNGFVAFPDLRVFSLVNMTSLSFNKGQKLEVQMEEFWQGQQLTKQDIPSKLFNIRFNEIEISDKRLVSRLIMHFLALY